MKTIEYANILNMDNEVTAIIVGKEYKHYIKFNSMIEATTFFDEILKYEEYVVTNITKKESADT